MRRVLATITNSPFGFGGVSSWIERITESLPERGWEVTTMTHALDQQHLVDWSTKHPNLALRPIYGRFAKFNQIEQAFDRYFEEEKPDIVIINGSYWTMPAIQNRKRRGEQVRVFGVCHADDNGYYKPLQYYRECFDHVIGVSETCYRKLLALGFEPERTSLLPYGVPSPSELPVHSTEGPLRLVYVGRLVQHQKRIFDFVPLISRLNASHVDYRLDFFGSGEEEIPFRDQVEKVDYGHRVHFHGWLPAGQVATIWRDEEVLLLLSEYEGLAISVLEAMAYGVVPVVSRVDSGVMQIIQQNRTGFTFPVGDIDACSKEIERLWRQRSRIAEIARNAWSVVREQYSIQRHTERLAELLDASLRKPPVNGRAHYMGMTSHPIARLVPGQAFVLARRLAKRGNPINEGYSTFP